MILVEKDKLKKNVELGNFINGHGPNYLLLLQKDGLLLMVKINPGNVQVLLYMVVIITLGKQHLLNELIKFLLTIE